MKRMKNESDFLTGGTDIVVINYFHINPLDSRINFCVANSGAASGGAAAPPSGQALKRCHLGHDPIAGTSSSLF